MIPLKKQHLMFYLNILLLLIGFSCTWILFFDCFNFPYYLYIVFILCIPAILLSFLYEFMPAGKKNALLLLFLFLWIITGFIEHKRLVEGLLLSSRYILPDLLKLFQYDYGVMAELTPLNEWNSVFFCIYVLIPYISLLTWVVVRLRSAIFSTLLTAPVFAVIFAIDGLPNRLFMVLLFSFWATLLLQPKRLPLEMISPQYDSAVITAACFAIFSAVFFILFTWFPQEKYTTSPHIHRLRNGIMNSAADIQKNGITLWRTKYAGGDPIMNSDGTINLDATGYIQFPNKDILNVYSPVPQQLYLRGYSASEYTGHKWLLDTNRRYNTALLPSPPLAYMETVKNIYFSGDADEIIVEPLNIQSNYLFTPYLLYSFGYADPLPKWVGDSHLAADNQPIYSFYSYNSFGFDTAISGNRDSNLQYYINRFSNIMRYGSVEFEGQLLDFTSTLGGPSFFNSAEILFYSAADSYYTATTTMDDDIFLRAYDYFNNPPDTINTLSLFYPKENADFDYLLYITDAYTQLPDGVQEPLLQWWEDALSQKNDIPRQYAISTNTPYWNWILAAQLVSEEIKNTGAYTYTPGPQPKNRDFAEYFLTESKQGYCVHFASATAAVLRSLGVPARYVEGYVVNESSFKDNGWAAVPAKQAHAWAEIWIPNFGWFPVDATPEDLFNSSGDNGFIQFGNTETDSMEEAEPEPPADEPSDPPEPQEDIEAPPSQTQETNLPLPQEKTYSSAQTVILRVVKWGLVLFFILGVLLLLRTVSRLLRKSRFEAKDTNQAALFMYQYLKRLTAFGGIIPSSVSALALKARFSQHQISKEELALLKRAYQEQVDICRAQLHWRKKIYFWLSGF